MGPGPDLNVVHAHGYQTLRSTEEQYAQVEIGVCVKAFEALEKFGNRFGFVQAINHPIDWLVEFDGEQDSSKYLVPDAGGAQAVGLDPKVSRESEQSMTKLRHSACRLIRKRAEQI